MAQKEPKHVAYLLCVNTNTIIISIIVVLTGSILCFTINRLGQVIKHQSNKLTKKKQVTSDCNDKQECTLLVIWNDLYHITDKS